MKTWIIVEKRCASITGNALPIQIQWTRENQRVFWGSKYPIG
jgi:hypothetical protein